MVNPFYMGDYIGVAANATPVSLFGSGARGVIVAWGDNSLGDANVMSDRR